MEHHLPALLQLHLNSRLSTWLQYIAQRQNCRTIEKHLGFEIWCRLYWGFDGISIHKANLLKFVPRYRLHKKLAFDGVNSLRLSDTCMRQLIGSDNGLSLGRRQAIVWANAGLFLIWPVETKFSELLNHNHTFSFKKMPWSWRLPNGGHLTRPQCVNDSLLEMQQAVNAIQTNVKHFCNAVGRFLAQSI